MRLLNNPTVFILGAMLAVSMPMLAAQQSASPPESSSPSSQATAHPSHSAASANDRAANLLNTINSGEIDTAKMMAGKTQNSQVKDFANMIASDHQDSQSKLQSIAEQASINLKATPSLQKENESLDQKLEKDSTAAADKAYVRAEARDHRTAIRELQRMEPNVTNTQLKDFVQSQIPVLRKHLDAAEKLEAQLGASASPNAMPSKNAGSK